MQSFNIVLIKICTFHKVYFEVFFTQMLGWKLIKITNPTI